MQFHILSFEGPDAYSRAGGIATRVEGLARALADLRLETHVWFVGDPDLPGHEEQGDLHLHRLAQWVSRHHPGGVYDGEEGKRLEYAASLPPYLLREILGPHLRREAAAMRRAARSTALRYASPRIVERVLIPGLEALPERPVRDSLQP